MIILKSCKRISIVASEKAVKNGNKNYIRIMFQNRTYQPDTWKCLSDPDERPLYPNLRSEYTEGIEEAKQQFDVVHAMFSESTPEPSPTPTATPTNPAMGQLEQLFCEVLAKQSVDTVLETAKPILKDYIKTEFGTLPQKHEVVTPTQTHEFVGVTHEKFDDVLNLVNLDIPVFLTGQAGTGKNVICKQVAKALGLEFYFTNAVTQEYQLKGFIDANGTFHDTQFYKAFTQGGLFFLDEMDASIPETLIILNAAIANRYFDFPTGRVEANENFRVIAAGNTFGTGADIEYTGRYQLDAASLDRFAMIEVDYSPSIEKSITEDNEELISFAHEWRKETEKAGIRCLFTYRSMERISKLEKIFDLEKTLQISLTKGLRKDDLKIIANSLNKKENRYAKALEKLAG